MRSNSESNNSKRDYRSDKGFSNEERSNRRNTRHNNLRCRGGKRGRANKWGTLSYNNNHRNRDNYRNDRYPSTYINDGEPHSFRRYSYIYPEEHPDANEGYTGNEPRNSIERTSLLDTSLNNESFHQYFESNFASNENPDESAKNNEVCNKDAMKMDSNTTGSPLPFLKDVCSTIGKEVSLPAAENFIVQQVKQEKCLENVQKAKAEINENAAVNSLNEKSVPKCKVSKKEPSVTPEPVPKSIKKKKKRRKSSEDVVCLGQIDQFENLVDDSNDDQVSESERFCLICDKIGHTSFRCQMICKNCSAPYHNLKTCPQPINMSTLFQQFMDFCMQQSCQYNPEFKFRIGNNVNMLTQQTSPEKKEKRRKNDEESNDSETDSSSDTKIVAKKRKKRKKKSDNEIEQNQHFPAFSSPFGQTLPFTAFTGHTAAAYNPMMAFGQMIPGAYNPATVAAMTFKR